MALQVRPAQADDVDSLVELDHSYATEYVWQMEQEQEGPQTGVRFRETRLPRLMTVAYPRPLETLAKSWKNISALMVAANGDEVLGYIALDTRISPGAAWVTDMAVSGLKRRQGIGTELLRAGQGWARGQGQRKILLEMQSKNHPAIRMAQKLAYEFCGYNDRYYPNQDIAIFFAKTL